MFLTNAVQYAARAFTKVLQRDADADTRLGNPLSGVELGAYERRLATMSAMTGGKGFKVQAAEPATDAQGLTRGQRKHTRRDVAMAKVSEQRAPQFLHSAARRKLEA